ncbi:tryptophan synthase subunit alpha [Euhalothece natronophila Z-M001]|uniref:Tryptophan synthase alpha chain n=1 Tax=Euhalothece natronophila Z-M001 TaxID=522448 RepID=A0A5B8NMA5_9CHRO|nr:tryptophan synthase subunit alpha [Euhalothece natronophila]QDZ39420.1 tryptophan synthase subunit alpha [Euhalothece natronophila Z-M001]
MTTVSQCFQTLRQEKKCALIPFLTAGDPDLETTAKALPLLDRAGADFIELGVPYSDPLADGPVIQAAATRALKRGVKLGNVLEVVETVRDQLRSPIVLFSYYNPIYHQGVHPFLKRISQAGVKGLVIPDIPLEEAETILKPAQDYGVEVTLLVAPTSPEERIRAIAQKSQGFIYLVSVTGVTGTRTEVGSRVKELLPLLRQASDKPVCVGFGVSQPQHAEQIKNWGADGVIAGSAFVNRLAQADSPDMGLTEIEAFCRSLKAAI